MHLILLSGGSGQRLWPMSNDVRSKQFLRVMPSPDGTPESMIQRVVRQIGDANLASSIVVATSKAQLDFIERQLPGKVTIVAEPERRNTFPAIALAAAYLADEAKVDLSEPIIVMPCDTFTEPHYFEVIRRMGQAIEENRANLVLMGIRPTGPETKFGYIVPASEPDADGIITVDSFKEKPDEATAANLIARGALWNGGVFGFRLSYLIDTLRAQLPDASYRAILEGYANLPKISFDYEVVEKADSIAAVPFEGLWKDLGTWDSLVGHLQADTLGRAIRQGDTSDTYIINETSTPIICAGARGVIIAVTPDGILVADKQSSAGIKAAVEQLSGRPMYEERRWGWYRVIGTSEHPDGHRTLTKHIHLDPGCSISYQTHDHRDETWTFIDGEGLLVVDDVLTKVTAGCVAQIHRGQKHTIRAVTPLEFIEVQTGNPLVESDIHRLSFDWDSIQ